MSIRKTPFFSGEYYHIYNRGNDKKVIFHDSQDRRYFLSLLYLVNSKEYLNMVHLKRKDNFEVFEFVIKDKLVAVGAYVIMSNHFHLLLTEHEGGGISKFMQKLCTGYVMYYNNKYKRTGSLFEGKFKSEHLSTDIYLKYIFSYIHLNPMKLLDKNWKEKGIRNLNEASNFLHNYKYSSFWDFAEGFSRKESVILGTKYFPDYFPNKQTFLKEIISWLKFKA